MKSLIILGLVVFTPFIGHCDEDLLNEKELSACSCFEIPEKNDQKIVTRIWKTEQNVVRLTDNDFTAVRVCSDFLNQLHMIYRNGEGLIAKDMFRILDAIDFAAHKYQYRKDKSGQPRIVYFLNIANRLLLDGHVRDADTLIASLVYNTIVETDSGIWEISEQFGVRVESFVKELTEHKFLSRSDRRMQEVVLAPGKSAGAAQIVLAAKLCKLETLFVYRTQNWTKDPANRYVMFTTMVVNALPWVNAPLKNAVDAAIAAYWNQQ